MKTDLSPSIWPALRELAIAFAIGDGCVLALLAMAYVFIRHSH